MRAAEGARHGPYGSPFLSLVAATIRRGRPLLPAESGWTVRTETVAGAPFIRVWFRTAGCNYDRQGRCTFCDYGRGPATSADQMKTFVQDAIAAAGPLAPSATILVSPSGSMLDEREVPAAARRSILEVVAATDVGTLLVETRAETVSVAGLAELADLLRGRRVAIEVGLESADPWVARYALNKGLAPGIYQRAVRRIGDAGMAAQSNVLIGAPFLSAAEAVRDAESTVRSVLSTASSSAIIFPIHVRRWTVLGELWDLGLYQPPSLWALVEVLERLDDLAERVSISWYRDYNGGGGSTAALASPTTCPSCETKALRVLDAFRATGSRTALAAFDQWPCTCRSRWRALLAQPGDGSREDMAAAAYQALSHRVLGPRWWRSHGPHALADLSTQGVGNPQTALRTGAQ